MATKTIDTFIKEANIIHDNKYDYSLTNYVNNITNVEIICKEHGIFTQRPSHHIRGSGCKKCNYGRPKLSMCEVINRFIKTHNDRYSYDKVIYNKIDEYVIITCKIHGDFKQTPHKHMNGRGCSKCSETLCIKENKWLDSLNIIERQVKISKYIVDGYDPKTNTIYEFDGDYWHGNPDVYNSYDYNKTLNKTFGELYNKTIEKRNYLLSIGYNVISIWENDFNKMKFKL